MGTAIARAAHRVARDMHRRGRLSGTRLPLLTALCAAGLLAACQSVGAGASTRPQAEFDQFKGAWVYAQSCGWQHSAGFEFSSDDSGTITGMWAEGTQVRGESGKLTGELRDGKLFMRKCRIDVEDDDPAACPNFGDESDYVVREGDRLAWYQRFGTRGYLKSLELQRSVEGVEIRKDDDCEEDQ
ncbi:MAG TPA: hypothetical protein VM619_03060 [Luteimonas sp.]|nr:hypothetical protein [Luteimonas sp.]